MRMDRFLMTGYPYLWWQILNTFASELEGLDGARGRRHANLAARGHVAVAAFLGQTSDRDGVAFDESLDLEALHILQIVELAFLIRQHVIRHGFVDLFDHAMNLSIEFLQRILWT